MVVNMYETNKNIETCWFYECLMVVKCGEYVFEFIQPTRIEW